MVPLLVRNHCDLKSKIRLIRTLPCHQYLQVATSLHRLLFRMLTCHRVTLMCPWILIPLWTVLLMILDLLVFRRETLSIHRILVTPNYLVLPFPLRPLTVRLLPCSLMNLCRRAFLFRLFRRRHGTRGCQAY